MSIDDNCFELAIQLGTRVCNTVYDWRRICQSENKHLLDMGRLLLGRLGVRLLHDLRNQEFDFGGSQ